MFPDDAVFIDLETTGTRPLHDRIIEIGLCGMREDDPVGEWSSLVNPGRVFSPFIERLTGISNGMTAEAPAFAELAGELMEKLAGRTLVAHNARFDYGFLKNEFRRVGIDFQMRMLCTVKLSRALFPRAGRHNLDSLIDRHGLDVRDRHRALGDARVVREFIRRVRDEMPSNILGRAVMDQLRQPSLPPHLPKEQVAALPGGPGVYLLYGENDAVLYVGKSVDIRSRVLSHFAGDHRETKGMSLSRQVRRIDWVQTAGELGALLLEARLIKDLAPIHNRRLRRSRDLVSLRLEAGKGGVSILRIVPMAGAAEGERFFGMFRSRREAERILREIVRTHGLCQKILGLETGTGACFGYQIKKCRGACVGEEPLALHEARLLQALAGLRMRSWPFRGTIGIREKSPVGDLTEIHLFDHWRHLGTADSEERLREILEQPDPLPFDLDGYKILTRFLGGKGGQVDVLDFSRQPGGVNFG